jgi:hypothetical protein
VLPPKPLLFSFFLLHGAHYDRKVALLCRTQNDIPVVRYAGGTHAKNLSLSICYVSLMIVMIYSPDVAALMFNRRVTYPGPVSIFVSPSCLHPDVDPMNSQGSSIMHYHAASAFDIHDAKGG